MIADVLEWVFWIFTLGQKRPGQLGRQQIEYSCLTHIYRIDKARERMAYNPTSNFDEGIRKAVMWSLADDGWSARLKKDN